MVSIDFGCLNESGRHCLTGAFGVVSLVRDKGSGQLYAMKQV
jgi:hypothetical protein